VIIGRFFFVLGRGTSTMIDVQEFCKRLIEIETDPQELPILQHNSNVKNQRDIIHVRDAARAVSALMENGKDGEIYNIGSGKGTTTQMIFTTLASASSKANDLKIQYNSKIKVRHEKFVVADTNKLTNTTGWTAGLTVEKAVIDELNYWRTALKRFD
jgi:GDP-4-dehydro-6-deoxy-D-mannose reductase